MILVGHEEMNIACTVILLKGLWAIGKIEEPIPVQLCLPGTEHVGWRQAAIEYLDKKLEKNERKRRSKVDWREVNEELDFYDKRAKSH